MLSSLQSFGVPGAPELLIILLLFLVIFGLGRWVYRDAKKRGSKYAWQWGFGIPVLLLFYFVPGVVALIVYISVRD